MNEERTVREAMLRHPTLHPAGLSIPEARAAFDRSEKTHLLLLTSGAQLVSTVARADVDGVDPELPAATAGALTGRTIAPDAPLDRVHEEMVAREQRRLAVVDGSTRLLGLLCLKRSSTGFCTDEGVRSMRRARRGFGQGPPVRVRRRR